MLCSRISDLILSGFLHLLCCNALSLRLCHCPECTDFHNVPLGDQQCSYLRAFAYTATSDQNALLDNHWAISFPSHWSLPQCPIITNVPHPNNSKVTSSPFPLFSWLGFFFFSISWSSSTYKYFCFYLPTRLQAPWRQR